MVDEKDSEAILLMSILQEPNPKKARRRYVEAVALGGINDQAVYDLIEASVFDAIMRRAPVVEIDRELAQSMLLLLKNGIKRSRGGQPSTGAEKLSKSTLVALGRSIKAERVASGMSATEAHLEGAEEAAEEAARRGLKFSAEYLAREMEKTED